jgi:Superinfection immunity protein
VIASILTTLVLTAIAAALYLLPVLVGWGRRVPDIGSVAVINILLGWTLVGWAVALALALRSVKTDGPAAQSPPGIPPWPSTPPGGLPPGDQEVQR